MYFSVNIIFKRALILSYSLKASMTIEIFKKLITCVVSLLDKRTSIQSLLYRELNTTISIELGETKKKTNVIKAYDRASYCIFL